MLREMISYVEPSIGATPAVTLKSGRTVRAFGSGMTVAMPSLKVFVMPEADTNAADSEASLLKASVVVPEPDAPAFVDVRSC